MQSVRELVKFVVSIVVCSGMLAFCLGLVCFVIEPSAGNAYLAAIGLAIIVVAAIAFWDR